MRDDKLKILKFEKAFDQILIKFCIIILKLFFTIMQKPYTC